MARQSKSLSNVFDKFNENHKVEEGSNALESNIANETQVEQEEVTLNTPTIEGIKQDLLSMYEEKTNKEKVEDTHIRTTFLFKKDLANRLDMLAKNKRGFKTMFMNKAIEALLEEMEKK
ncbi:hypothetical protein SAMN05880501_11825 [Ureibacillus xyleni]|uniref:Uncharacterized protein n=1 Tax=Ureibacillus xyleni TaxID=614648 RepID=A0A285TR88_9BACL|nr:hypothetical protein [Ureibacillus xyleni]SOC25125.1 hypothetical protein SAMN05880501_11825 [Ureibacillus xyleni]